MPFHDGLPAVLPPTEDGVFQSTFSREGANTALLDLLTDILERPLKNVTLRRSELPIANADAKREVFDINCVAKDDRSQIEIEMQAARMRSDKKENENIGIRNRSVFNLSDLHARQPGRGIRYADFNYSYQIMICNYNVFNWDNRLVEKFNYRNEQCKLLTDITTSIFVDLSQVKKIIKKPVSEMSALEQWAVFFTKVNEPEFQDMIDEIVKRKEGISVAYDMLTSISMDENERARYHSRLMWQLDRDNEMASAKYEVQMEYEQKLADKDAALANKDAIIAELRAKLEGRG